MVFHERLWDNKSFQVSRNLLSILADLHNAVVWIVSIRLPTFNSSSPFSKPLATVLSAPITTGITVTLCSTAKFSGKVQVVVSHFAFFDFHYYCFFWGGGRGGPGGVMAKVLDCGLQVSEFELQSHCHVHIRTNALEEMYEPLPPLILPAMG